MTAYALRLTNGADTAERARQADTFGVMPAGPLKARSGVRPDGGLVTSVVAGTMQVRVSPGSAFIDPASTLGQGGYTFVVDAQPSTGETITLDNGDATGARVDTICAQVLHNVYDSSGQTLARVVAIKGNPATGVAPVIPAGHLPLRDVNVPQSRSAGNGGLAAANLGADRRVPTVSLGGIDPVSSLDAANALPFKYEGQYVDLADTDQLMRWNGTSWVSAAAPVVGTWQDYNPVWRNGSGNANAVGIGNGSLTGRYKQDAAKQVTAIVRTRRESSSAVGTTFYSWDLPVTPRNFLEVVGAGWVFYGNGATGPVAMRGVNDAAGMFQVVAYNYTGNQAVSNSPAISEIRFQVTYEAA